MAEAVQIKGQSLRAMQWDGTAETGLSILQILDAESKLCGASIVQSVRPGSEALLSISCDSGIPIVRKGEWVVFLGLGSVRIVSQAMFAAEFGTPA